MEFFGVIQIYVLGIKLGTLIVGMTVKSNTLKMYLTKKDKKIVHS